MNKLIRTSAIILACIASLSCIKEKLEVTYNNQESKIDKFIESSRYQTVTEEAGTTRTLEVPTDLSLKRESARN